VTRAAAAGKLRAALPYAAVLLGAAFLYAQTSAFAELGREGHLGPAFWPRAVLILLMIVCAAEIARVAFFFKPAEPEAPMLHSAAPVSDEDGERFPKLLAGGIAITVLYVPAMDTIGFFLATILYLAAFMWIGRYRRPVVVAVTSVLGTLAFVYVFMKIVYVSLPLGAGPFRELSAWVLAALGVH
jgi:putative tricarboxylic transport membrane protein